MTWHLGNLAPFDIESTGVDVENDRIVSATVAHITPGQSPQVFSHLVAVDVDIPEAATAVHGITTEYARANGTPAIQVLNAVAADLTGAMLEGTPIVGSNLVYDFTLLDRELRRNSLPTVEDRLGRPIAPVVDVFVIDKALDMYRPGKRQLNALCAHYGVRLDDAHDSTADALAAARVAFKLGQRGAKAMSDPLDVMDIYAGRRYPENIVRAFQVFSKMTLAELHEAQAGWYAEQATSLAQYFRRQANELEHRASRATDEAERATRLADAEELRRRADDVTSSWPIRPFGGAR